MIDWQDFQRDDTKFHGNYRAYVEDNDDPFEVGRVRVRIVGLHSPNPEETTVDQLPWAEQAVALYYSGGKNINDPYEKQDDRYVGEEGGDSKVPKRDDDDITEEWKDDYIDGAGTGGHFTVPRKGSVVWVFFENGDHTRPHYWAMIPDKNDWDKQKEKIIKDIDKRIEVRDELRDEFEPDDKNYKGSSPITNHMSIITPTEKPKLEFGEIDDSVKQKDLTTTTSSDGTTYITLNEEGKERHYLIHKSYIRNITETGNVLDMIGKIPPEYGIKEDSEEGEWNDYQHTVANNYELHILGDWSVHVVGNCFFQCDKNIQINAKKDIGLVSRENNINIMTEKGSINLESKDSVTNIFSKKNMQIRSEKDIKLRSDEDLDYYCGGEFRMTIQEDGRIEARGDCDLYVQGNLRSQVDGDASVTINEEADILVKQECRITSERSCHLLGKENVYVCGDQKVNIKGIDTLKIESDGDLFVEADGKITIKASEIAMEQN